MAEASHVQSPGDLEAVVLAESFDLLSSIVGPSMYKVSGGPGEQQAIFATTEVHTLFYIRVHEFLANATRISASASVPAMLSLFSGGLWLAGRHPERAERVGLRAAYEAAEQWLAQTHRIVFWAPSVWRHLRLELPMFTLISMRANMEKHQLLRLSKEIRRLQSRLTQAGCKVALPDVVNVRGEFYDHIRGMLEYHATQVVELVGKCFLGLFRFVRELYLENPTNNLDAIRVPGDVSDDVFRYMYAATVFRLSQWSEERIVSATPQTSPSFRMIYPQHAAWDIVESERGDV